MKKEIFDLIKKEMKYLSIIFIVVLLAFKVAFYKESLPEVIKIVISIFWLFVLPGYFFMLRWNNLPFGERTVIGILLSASIYGITSYYLGLAGIHIKYHSIILPLMIIIAAIVMNLKNIKD